MAEYVYRNREDTIHVRSINPDERVTQGWNPECW